MVRLTLRARTHRVRFESRVRTCPDLYHLTPVSAFHIAVISHHRHLETLLSWESFGGTLTNIAEGLCMCIDNVNFEVGSICRSLGLRIIDKIR